MRIIINLVARVEIRGKENLPPEGGFVIASNHLGLLDAFLVHYALNDWKLFVLIGEKWGKNPLFHWVGKHLNFLFIDRFNPDLKAMRETIGRMKAGQVLVIAPEGTRSRTGRLQRGKAGVVPLALRSGAPLLPLVYFGHEGFNDNVRRLHRTDFHIVVGEPFRLLPGPEAVAREVRQAMADEIMRTLATLLPPENRGVYADFADHPRRC